MNERDIFVAALHKTNADERAAFLAEACGDDTALRERVQALLHEQEQLGSFLESPAAAVHPIEGGATAARATVDYPAELPGTVIGPYKLLEQIGEGGFGVVFMAEQVEPVRRKVALKILKPGMDTKQVVARFEAERQALAIMDHPNIAKVHDGGATLSGRPYLVMELVKGVPITDFCDRNHLTPRQRLELFVPVCQAVQHAHQKGIIHRDLKPSNILVVMHDTTPVPKVIDFGVAKALGQELTDKTLFTGFAQMIGTPLYMSPEQAGQSGLDIDTRSDIYALGVLLYELLTGTTPFSKERFRQAAYDEIRRIIREEEPPKPSTRLSDLNLSPSPSPHRGGERAGVTTTLASVAAQRHTEPAKLTRLVKGELDWIVMKALEKDRNRRYETANGFAMDVQRYLADEPVLACPPSAGYRLRKVLRRNRGTVLAASLVLGVLVAGVVSTTWQAVRAERRAEGERQAKERAEANFKLANEAVEKYLGTVTEDPDLKRADFHRLRKKLLESAIPFFQKIAEQKSDDPKVEARRGHAHGRLGQVRQELGEYEAAVLGFEESQAIFARLHVEFPNELSYRHFLAMSLNSLGHNLAQLGERGRAEPVLRQALGISEKLAADVPDDPEYRHRVAMNHGQLGMLLNDLGRLVDAEAALRQAVATGEEVAREFPRDSEYRYELAGSHNNLGALLISLGRMSDAHEAHLEAFRILEKLVAEFPAEPKFRHSLAGSHYNLGILLDDLGKSDESEAHYRQAIKLDGQLVREFPTVPEYRQDLAVSHTNLGLLMRDLARWEDAESSFREALPILESLVTDFPKVPGYRLSLAETYGRLGTTLSSQGKQSQAEDALRQAVARYERLNADFPGVPGYLVNLGGSYCNSGNMFRDGGQSEAALDWFKKAITTLEPVLAQEPRLTIAREFLRNSHWSRALALDDLGRRTEATRDWERALELDDGANGATFRLRILRNKRDAAGCLAAAAEFEALNPGGTVGMYEAACNRAVCAAAILEDPKTPAADATRLAREQADLAMAWLRKTIDAGYHNAVLVKHDTNLDALREREDFKKLLAELEAKQKGK
jgi:serine/threonine protein kinase/Flp pilus assembly protein TadD